MSDLGAMITDQLERSKDRPDWARGADLRDLLQGYSVNALTKWLQNNGVKVNGGALKLDLITLVATTAMKQMPSEAPTERYSVVPSDTRWGIWDNRAGTWAEYAMDIEEVLTIQSQASAEIIAKMLNKAAER